jgi:hypothetical protein
MLATRHKVDPAQGDTHQETPEIRLLRGMIERAITDAIKPQLLRDRRACPEFRRKRKERYKRVQALRQQWRASGLNTLEFAAVRELCPVQFNKDLHWLSGVITDRSLVGNTFPCACEWIWNDSVVPFSFLWCLSFFFDDAEGVAEKIKKYILISRKNIACE